MHLSRSLLGAALAVALLPLAARSQVLHTVNQVNATFVPANLVIDVGDTVRWVWSSGTHTVTEGSGPIPVGGEAFNETLDAANPAVEIFVDAEFLANNPRTNHVYNYYCIPDFALGMIGSITVREVYGMFLDQSQEVPPSGAAGFGSGTLKLNRVSNEIDWNFSWQGLTGPATLAHFHGPAAPGVLAGVQLTLSPITPNIDVDFVSAAQETQIRSHLWYANIHTAANGGGEIRGQIMRGTWTNLGGSTAGSNGTPHLRGIGPLTGLSALFLDLRNGPPNKLCLLWITTNSTPANFFGGTIHALPIDAEVLLPLDGNGQLFGGAGFPPFVPSGTNFVFQFLVEDPSVIFGLTLSNGLRATAP